MSEKKPTRPKQSTRIPNVGDRIIAGLTELRDAIHAGMPLASRFTVRTVSMADPDPFDARRVRRVRAKLGLSQAVFAKIVGVSNVLAQSWEQGRREPSPLAR